MTAVRQFLETLWGPMVGNAVVGALDKPGPKGQLNRFEDFKYPEQLDQIVEWVEARSAGDVYASPLLYGEIRNPDNGKVRRIPENALTSNTVYQDSDTCEQHNFRIVPSIHLQSSAGKYQDFWLLDEPVPAEDAARISHKIAIAHRKDGSDPSSWSANKLLRIPATHNTKHGFAEEVLAQYSGTVYNALDIEGAYEDIELENRPILRLPPEVSIDSDMDLPDYMTALNKLPNGFDTEILTKEVPSGVDRSRMRYRMLGDLFRAGIDFEDVLSIAWHAPSCRKWKEDPRNVRGLVSEALKVQAEAVYQTGNGEYEDDEFREFEDQFDAIWPKLLTDSERTSIAGDDNWIRRYDEWNRVKLESAYNAPYSRMMAWQLLSAAFSDAVFIPRGNGPEGCNLFSMSVGNSGSGKSSSVRLYQMVMDELFEHDKGWYIGSNSSPNALHEKLIERDLKFSCMRADEAHGWFKQVNTQQWADGIYEALAEYYDGQVPPMLRTGNREISGKTARVWFNMNLLGTMKGELSLSNVLTRHMFLSGFLARFIWTIGDEKEVTEDSIAETQATGDYIKLGYEPMARQWAAEFNNTKRILRKKHNRKTIAMLMDADALERLSKAKWDMNRMFQGARNWEILQPSLIRLGSNIRRAATLLATEEQSETVTMRHTLLAIEASEEWLNGLQIMADKISDSDWSRQTEEAFTYLASKDRISYEAFNRRFREREPRIILMMLESLKAQGRVAEKTENGRKWLVAR